MKYLTFCSGICALCVLRYVKLRFIVHVKSTLLPSCVNYVSLHTLRCVIYVFSAHVNYVTFCYGMRVLCVLRYVTLRFVVYARSPTCVECVMLSNVANL